MITENYLDILIKERARDLDMSMVSAIQTLKNARQRLKDGKSPGELGILQGKGNDIERLASEISLLMQLRKEEIAESELLEVLELILAYNERIGRLMPKELLERANKIVESRRAK